MFFTYFMDGWYVNTGRFLRINYSRFYRLQVRLCLNTNIFIIINQKKFYLCRPANFDRSSPHWSRVHLQKFFNIYWKMFDGTYNFDSKLSCFWNIVPYEGKTFMLSCHWIKIQIYHFQRFKVFQKLILNSNYEHACNTGLRKTKERFLLFVHMVRMHHAIVLL